LIAGKDPMTALDAVSIASNDLPGIRLHLLASDRAMESTIRARLECDPILRDRVELHDPVPSSQIDRWYRGAPIFMSTSHREGSGYSLIEALTCGCAPVVTAIPPHLAILAAADAPIARTFPVGAGADAGAALVQVAMDVHGTSEPIVNNRRSLLHWDLVARQLVDAYHHVLPRDC